MTKSFEFYFDFASPYAFIAHKKIIQIITRNNFNIIYMPILLGGLQKMAGIVPPGMIPIKAKHMIRDCKLWAEKDKISFKFNTYFPINTLNLMRGVIVAEKKNFSKIFIDKIFDAIWKDGLNLNDENILEKLLKNLELNPEIFLKESNQVLVKDELKKRTDEAYEKGVFGAPTFIANKKLFWGQDRLEFVIDELNKN